MRLFWHPFSIFPRRVRIALREKGIPCDEVEVDLPGGATRSPEFRTLNPFGQVPVLEDGHVIVYESIAILEYLEERHPSPPLLPSTLRARARARELMHAAGDYFAAPFKRWTAQFFAPAGSWDPADVARAGDEIATLLDVLEPLLYGRDYLLNSFSFADVCWAPFVCELETARLVHLLDERPAVRAWTERLRARPSVQETAFGATS